MPEFGEGVRDQILVFFCVLDAEHWWLWKDLEAGQDASRQINTSLNNANSPALKGELFSPQTCEPSHIWSTSLRLMTYSPLIKT